MKKLIISALTACLAIGTAYAAKLCLGRPWIDNIALSCTSTSILKGATTTCTATVTGHANSTKKIRWSATSPVTISPNPQEATPNASDQATITITGGNVTAVTSGTIKAEAIDGSGKSASQTIKVAACGSQQILQNPNTASVACVSCSSSCSTSQNCNTQSCSIANGSCWYTGSYQTRSAACTNASGNTDTVATCAGWSACGNGSFNYSCNSGYTYNGSTCVVNTPTIHSNLTGVCSSSFINSSGCQNNDTHYHGTGQNSYFIVYGCVPGTVYGNSRCSPTYGSYADTGYPTNSNGNYCWCQLCSGSSRTSCGNWVFRRDFSSYNDNGSTCSTVCANSCSSPIYINRIGDPDFLAAACYS